MSESSPEDRAHVDGGLLLRALVNEAFRRQTLAAVAVLYAVHEAVTRLAIRTQSGATATIDVGPAARLGFPPKAGDEEPDQANHARLGAPMTRPCSRAVRTNVFAQS